MKKVCIDFGKIDDCEEFYDQLKEKLILPDYFGDNLDSLYDIIRVNIELPLHIEFVNMSIDQLDTFRCLLEIMEYSEENLEGFTFSYFLEQF